MNTVRKSVFLTLLLIGAAVSLMPLSAFAAGTASGTSITNKATINYQVGGVGQTLIESSPAGNATPGAGNGVNTAFLVDDKVMVTVSNNDGGFITTYPGANNLQALKFTVANVGNTVHDFALYSALVGTNTFVATSVTFYQDTNGNGTFDPGTDLVFPNSAGQQYIDDLASSGSTTATVFLVVNVPAGAVNNQTANYVVTAEAHQGSGAGSLGAKTTATAGADNPAAVDIVLADGAGNGNGIGGVTDVTYDGKYAQLGTNGFKISAPVLTVTKTSAVYSDPVNNTTNPKAIPGAIITYTVTIANAAGGATATSVSISDSLATEIIAGHLAFNLQFAGNAPACGATQGIVVNGTCYGNGTGDGDTGDWNVTAGNTVTVTGLSIAGGANAIIKFQTIVQ